MTPLTWVVGIRQLRPGWWEATATAGTWVLSERAPTREGAVSRLRETVAHFERLHA